MKNYYLFLAVIVFFVSFTSCSENGEVIVPQNKNEEPVAYKNDMLVFSNLETLEKVLNNKEKIPSSIPFISQKDLLDEIMSAEYDHASNLKPLSDEEYEKCNKHSEQYILALKNSLIKEESYEDGSTLYDLNIALPAYAKILNKQGFFAIKDTIYQLTSHQMKVWENCKKLEDIDKIDPKIIYTKTPQSKSLFPLNSTDQRVAYVRNSPFHPDRAILTFYDETVLVLPNVKRDIYIRASFQRKVDGRTYSYVAAPYRLDIFFELSVNGEIQDRWMSANGTGANDWYTPYFEYGILTAGKQSQIYTETYYYITRFTLKSHYTINHSTGDDQITVDFEGKRTTPLAGSFFYKAYVGEPFSPLLPNE